MESETEFKVYLFFLFLTWISIFSGTEWNFCEILLRKYNPINENKKQVVTQTRCIIPHNISADIKQIATSGKIFAWNPFPNTTDSKLEIAWK